ncbi:MAG: hypothetical protein RQ751_09105 [Longimicrobiales bacterium]|nr:hypothetical protein [Longimicrobiales bacterium]
MHRSRLVPLLAPLLLLPLAAAAVPWGADGHEMAARAAVAHLPSELPGFFAEAGAQLVWLNPEPDRWRERALPEMDQAFAYDHYVDLENIPAAARQATDRYRYLAVLYRQTELERPERDAGFLPLHILELYQRLVTGWALWHEAEWAGAEAERRFVEARIVNDAGLLGHYVTDAAQPHHTTIHFNGWNASGARREPNPHGYTESRDFHGRFESGFVRAHVDGAEVLRAAEAWPEPRRWQGVEAARAAVWAHLERSHGQVETLYRLERDHGFDPRAAAHPATVDFAVDRLADGARMLRDLWWNAWLDGTATARARREAGGV